MTTKETTKRAPAGAKAETHQDTVVDMAGELEARPTDELLALLYRLHLVQAIKALRGSEPPVAAITAARQILEAASYTPASAERKAAAAEALVEGWRDMPRFSDDLYV